MSNPIKFKLKAQLKPIKHYDSRYPNIYINCKANNFKVLSFKMVL